MELWQWHCRNRMEKKNLQLVCGNAIAKIGGNFFFFLAIVAIALPKKKKCYEICESVKKSCHIHNIFTIFSQ